jgi:thioredoxin reductase
MHLRFVDFCRRRRRRLGNIRSTNARRPDCLPGVFAVGDVRSGNVKRVASAVGEGSIAVASVHQVLRE